MAMMATHRWELTIDADYDTVVSDGTWLDDHWQHRDTAGHEHQRVDGGYPTLRWVVDRTEPCDGACGDPDHVWEFGHWECRECGEHIEPGKVPCGVTVIVDTHVTATYSGLMDDGVRVKGRVPQGEIDELIRRLRMTTTPAIMDRIIGKWVAHHPETITERSYGS